MAAEQMHLSELVRLAERRGWLTAHDASALTDVLNKVRTMAAHPGAYVRGMRNAPADYDLRDDAGYLACFDILARASEQLRAADLKLLQPTRP